jgi:hypothetical protein
MRTWYESLSTGQRAITATLLMACAAALPLYVLGAWLLAVQATGPSPLNVVRTQTATATLPPANTLAPTRPSTPTAIAVPAATAEVEHTPVALVTPEANGPPDTPTTRPLPPSTTATPVALRPTASLTPPRTPSPRPRPPGLTITPPFRQSVPPRARPFPGPFP